ncbi:MAG: hypothetical protein K6E52_06705 [Bacteroidaceae bacterium]|nr:hypothetical protein [Bacteroidaceae bacterium]
MTEETNNIQEQTYVPNYTSDDLHGVVKVIMWLSIITSGISIVSTVFSSSSNSVISPFWVGAEVLLGVITIWGAYQILQTEKEGYKALVATRLVIIVVTYFETREWLSSPQAAMMPGYVQNMADSILTRTFFVNIGQIIILSLILMLRKNGHSGFDVLWKRI